MAWPPATLPTNRTNATPQNNTHPADHNAISAAINDTVGKVQQIDALANRLGIIAVQSGQLVAGGAVVNLAWSAVSVPDMGAGPTFTVPANWAGVWTATLRVEGPVPAADTYGDIILTIQGEHYTNYIPAGKSEAAVSATVPLAVTDQVFASVYNPTVSSEFYIAALVLVRVSA